MYDLAKNSLTTLKHHCKKLLLGETVSMPTLIILGAQKSGTTAIYTYLSKHPNIQAPKRKELNYFSTISQGTANIDQYLALFPRNYARRSTAVSIDASPSYLIDCERCVGHAEFLGLGFKYLVSLREPVERAVSAWFMYKQLQQRNPNWFVAERWVETFQILGKRLVRRDSSFGNSFAADIETEIEVLEQGKRIECPIVEFGLYQAQLDALYSTVDASRVMLIDSQHLRDHTQRCLSEALAFMELADHQFKPSDLTPQFVGQNAFSLEESQLLPLKKFYEIHNKDLHHRFPSAKHWQDS